MPALEVCLCQLSLHEAGPSSRPANMTRPTVGGRQAHAPDVQTDTSGTSKETSRSGCTWTVSQFDKCSAHQTHMPPRSRHGKVVAGLQTKSACLNADTLSRTQHQPGMHRYTDTAAHRLKLPERQHLPEGLVRLICSVLQPHHVLQHHRKVGSRA